MSKPKVKLNERNLGRIFTSGIERVIATEGYEARCQVCGRSFTLRPESMRCPTAGRVTARDDLVVELDFTELIEDLDSGLQVLRRRPRLLREFQRLGAPAPELQIADFTHLFPLPA